MTNNTTTTIITTVESTFHNRQVQHFATLAKTVSSISELLGVQDAYMSVESCLDEYKEFFDGVFDKHIEASATEEEANEAAFIALHEEIASDYAITTDQAARIYQMVSTAVAIEREKEAEMAALIAVEEVIEAAEAECQGICSGCKSFDICAHLIAALADEDFTVDVSEWLCKSGTPAGARYRHHLMLKESEALKMLKFSGYEM